MKPEITKLLKQQPLLFEPFFGKELTPDNDFLTYIDTSSNNSNIVHKNSVTSLNSNDNKKCIKNHSNRIIKLINLSYTIKNTRQHHKSLKIDKKHGFDSAELIEVRQMFKDVKKHAFT